jgi:hypothetical protein
MYPPDICCKALQLGTVIAADPDFVVSCVEVAVIVAVPVEDGVNTPALLTLPIAVGVTDHATVELKEPVPFTLALQVDVCVVSMDFGEHVTVTEVIVGGGGGGGGGGLPVPPQPTICTHTARSSNAVRCLEG